MTVADKIVVRKVRLMFAHLTKPSSMAADMPILSYGACVRISELGFRPSYKRVKTLSATGEEFVSFSSKTRPLLLPSNLKAFREIADECSATGIAFDGLFRFAPVDILLESVPYNTNGDVYNVLQISKIHVFTPELRSALKAFVDTNLEDFKD